MLAARLRRMYDTEIKKSLMGRFGYQNIMQVPCLIKITLNMGVGEAKSDKKVLEYAQADLARITGQKPVLTRAKQSIAGFKIREGWPIGCKVTLRNKMMYEFLDRFISVTIPRIRDFRGFTAKAFDGAGNYTVGIEEQIVFPDVEYDKVDKIRGLNISITTSAKTDKEGYALLSHFKFPFKEKIED